MDIVTVDLNTGNVTEVSRVTEEDVERARRLFVKWIIPSFKDFRSRPGKKSFRRIGSHYFTAWSRKLEYMDGRVEYLYKFRASWDVDDEEMERILRVGFTLYEWKTGKLRCPWVMCQAGIWEVYLSDLAYSFIVEPEEWADGGLV